MKNHAKTNDGLRILTDAMIGLSLLSVPLLLVDCLVNADRSSKISAIAGDLGWGVALFFVSVVISKLGGCCDE